MSRTAPILMVVVLLAACGGEATAPTSPVAATAQPVKAPPPDTEAAQKVISSSAEIGDFEFTNAAFSLPMRRTAMNEPTRAAARDLARAGWISFNGSGKVTLKSKALRDKRFLVRQNDVVDIVPLAKKEIGAVTAVRQNADGTADADFTWKWIPNEIGRAFRSGPVKQRLTGEQSATATLLFDGRNWTVLRIRRR